MSDEVPRHIIIEKSSTVRRRYQRSNKRFKFTPEQIAKIEREQKAKKRAKELREKEDRRIENKKRKAEKEAREREERLRLGLPDPNAPKVPSSQPLLANFLAKRPAPVKNVPAKEPSPEPSPPSSSGPSPVPSPEPGPNCEPTDTETVSKPTDIDNCAKADIESTAGDTEVDSDFDDLDEDLEREMSNLPNLQGAGVLKETNIDMNDAGHDTSKDTLQTMCTDRDDDEFSDCSVFDDEGFIGITATMVTLRPGDAPDVRNPTPSKAPTVSPSSNNHPQEIGPVATVGESFRDEIADFLEEEWAHLEH